MPNVIMGNQTNPATARQQALQQGLAQITGGIQDYGQHMQQEAQTQRQQALAEMQFNAELAKQGVMPTPEQSASISSMFNPKKKDGIAGWFGAKEEANTQGLAGIYSGLAEQSKLKKARENKKEELQNDYINSQIERNKNLSKGGGISPYQQNNINYRNDKSKADAQIKSFDEFNQESAKTRERLESAKAVGSLLATGTPIASEVAKTQLARLAGEVGAITDADLSRYGGSRDLVNQFNQLLQRNANGLATPKDIEDMKGIVGNFSTILGNKLRGEASRHAKSRAKAYGKLGLTEKDFLDQYDVDSIIGTATDAPQNAQPGGPPRPSLEQAKAALRQLGHK